MNDLPNDPVPPVTSTSEPVNNDTNSLPFPALAVVTSAALHYSACSVTTTLDFFHARFELSNRHDMGSM